MVVRSDVFFASCGQGVKQEAQRLSGGDTADGSGASAFPLAWCGGVDLTFVAFRIVVMAICSRDERK